MKIVKDAIVPTELKEMAEQMFGNMVKAVVDTEREIMAVDAELYVDLLELLMDQEKSDPKQCWGINLYPDKTGSDFIEFDSMINLKPGLGNRTRGVEDAGIREKVIAVVKKLCSTSS